MTGRGQDSSPRWVVKPSHIPKVLRAALHESRGPTCNPSVTRRIPPHDKINRMGLVDTADVCAMYAKYSALDQPKADMSA